MSNLTAPEFSDETAAIAHVEASRWPEEVSCPHCGSTSVHRMEGKTQAGYFLCNDCRDKFTCRTGTVMERSHVPVHKWLLAIHLLNSGKNGVSAHELHRQLGITYKTAWFLSHRIREAMIDAKPTPMGGKGKSVQADETYYGNSSKRAKGYRKGHIRCEATHAGAEWTFEILSEKPRVSAVTIETDDGPLHIGLNRADAVRLQQRLQLFLQDWPEDRLQS